MSKLNDYFLNLLYNPEFSPGDFQTVGLNSGNTSIENKDNYKSLEFVKNHPLLQTEGVFDENKFDKLYELALVGYNLMSNAASNERLATSYSAFRDDVFAKSAKRTNQSETLITKIANPNRQLIGFVSTNIMENPTRSVREIAQSQMVWDGEINLWVDAPNDTTLNNFFNPKVLALYDEDVDVNGKSASEEGFDSKHLAHKKGDKKINPLTGTYYYETLNGRDIYGRDVLSGWDTLTRDGSAINAYDFFDSDDLEKSTGGSLLKAAVKIAPALIPTTAPWYVGARVLLGATDLFAKVGKMVSGSDSPFLSYLEGINKTFTQSSSDYSQGSSEMGILGNAWSLENLINLSADVFTQLAEQRWMFTHLPSLIKGNKLGFNKEALEEFKKQLSEKIFNRYKGLTDAKNISSLEKAIELQELKHASMMEAQSQLENILKESNKFGEHLSKLYMTGITVADSYGEAKEQGLSDTEAAIFTLAYAAGEYGILSTNLGEHILPELRAEKHKYRNIERVLREGKQNTSAEVKKDPRKWYLKLMGFAKEAVIGDYNDAKVAAAYAKNSTVQAVATSVASNALGEGLEEVSEELWFDIAKALYNGASELGLTSTGKTMETFDGGNLELVMNRYALNFIGGLAGGAIAVGLPGFQLGIKNMLGTNMDLKLAYLELVALIRNGKKDDFLRTIRKLETANSELSATKYQVVNGEYQHLPGDEKDNLDVANKTVLEGMVNLIDNLLTINGVKMDDQSILSKLAGATEMARFQSILGGDEVGSATLANYLLNYNTLSTKIADLAMKIDAIQHPRTDLKGEAQLLTAQNQGGLSDLQAEMNQAIKERDAYLNGDMAKIILPKVLFEMSPVLSYPYIQTNFKDYAEKVEGKTISDIPEERLNELLKAWENYKNSGFKDDIEYAFLNFMLITLKFSDKLGAFNLAYLKNPKNLLEDLGTLFTGTRQIIMNPENDVEDVLYNAQSFELTSGIAKNARIQKTVMTIEQLILNMNFSDSNEKSEILNALNVIQNLPLDSSTITSPEVIEDIKKLGQNIGVYFNELGDNANSQLKEILDKYINAVLTDILVNKSEQVKDVLKRIPYFNLSIRKFLNDSFFNLITEYDEDTGESLDNLYDFGDPEFEEILNKRRQLLKDYKDIINDKPITPIEELVDLFQLSIGDNTNVKMSDLIRVLQEQMTLKANQGVIEEFGFGTDIANQIKYGLTIIEAMSANILGARSDGGKLGAVFGFNSTVNQLNPDIKLTEIDLDSANTLLQDLAKLKTKLLYFLTIFNVNSGLKLEEQKRIAHRVNYAFIDKMKYIINVLPEDLNEKDENGIGVLDKLKAIINKATTYNNLKTDNKNFSLTEEEAKNLEKESIAILDSIYELFNHKNNVDKIENLDLSNIVKLLPSTDSESSDYNGTIIDLLLTSFDDRTAIMLLAAASAIKASDFYAEYKTSFIDGIAPIPGQELAVKMSYAFLLNKPMFHRFGKAYNNQILKEIQGIDSSAYWNMYGKNVAESAKLDNSYALLFFNTFLVEGIPGAGKTTGYQLVLLNMLNKYHPSLLEDVWLIHTSENKAKDWGNKLGLDPSKCHFYDRNSYLSTIATNYSPIKTNSNGIISITEDDLVEDEETGISHLKGVEISKSTKIPSLILIDESTRFSLLELLISELFQSNNDISAIATGDYDQIGAVGQYTDKDNRINFLNTFQDNFFHCPKLGSSMRTENTIKDLNIAITRKNKLETIKKLINGELVSPLIHLSYYQDDTGLYGERIIGKDSKDLDNTITLMLSTLKGERDLDSNWIGEKVTVIYLDKNSEIYKKLQEIASGNEEYKGKISFVESSAAQGDEGQYYIVDLNIVDIGEQNESNLGNHANFVNTFYTAISRSSQGTLIIENPNIKQIAETSRIQELVKSPLSNEAKEKYSKNRIDTLSEIITSEPGKTPDPINKRKKSSSSLEEGNPSTNSGVDTSEELATLLNTRTVNINNDNPSEYVMLLHSMPSMETGFELDLNGNYVPSVGSEGRIDGLNGIIKIAETKVKDEHDKEVPLSQYHKNLRLKKDGTLANLEEALSVLNLVVQAGLYLKDKNEIKKRIKEVLGLNLNDDEFGVDFLFMFRDTYTDSLNIKNKKEKGFLRTLKSNLESLFGIYRGKNTPEQALQADLNKQFALNVYRVIDGKRVNILTTPLAIFTNPLTMLNTKGFEKFKKEYIKLRDNLKFIKLLQDPNFINTLSTIEKANAKKLLKHFLIYTHKGKNIPNDPNTGDAVIYLDKTLAELATSITGPVITVKEKGGEYFHEKDYYNGEYTNIEDIDKTHHLTLKIYYTDKDIIVNGKTIIKKGAGFILATDYYKTANDDDLLQLFVDNELNDNPLGRISVIYVSSPKISITDYFKNFALKYKRPSQKGEDDPDIDTNIGNELSEFRIAEFITKENSPFDLYLKQLVNSNPDNKTNTLVKWEIFKSIIQRISSDFESLTGELRTLVILKQMKDTPYLDLIKYDGTDEDIKRAIRGLKGVYGDNNHTLKSFISNTLLNFVLKQKNGFIDEKLHWKSDGSVDINDTVKQNILKVEESVSDKFREGIFTKIKCEEGTEAINIGGYNFIESDAENYENLYGKFRTNGKIDSTMLVLDVNPIMDYILKVLNDPKLRGEQLNWYTKDTRPHTSENPKSVNVLDIVPQEIINQFKNKSELITLILNNPKNFENLESESIFSILISLGYTTTGDYSSLPNSLTLVKIPKGYTLSEEDMNYDIIRDSDNILWLIDENGEVNKITEEFFNDFPEDVMNEIKLDPDKQTDEELKLLSTIYKLVQDLKKGEGSALDIDSILNQIDSLPVELFTDENLLMLYPDADENLVPVTMEQFKMDIKDYIQSKNKDKLDNFIAAFGYSNVNIALLDLFLTNVESVADNYKGC